MEAEAPAYEGDQERTGTNADTPPNGDTVHVGDLDLYYELHGRGPTKILFIMGFATSCKAWLPSVEALLEQHGDEFEACIFDNRGCGRTSCPDAKFSTSVMAADTVGLLDHLQWQSVHVVGISMGGMIAQELALMLLPQKRLASLALAVTHAGGLYATAPMAGVAGMLSSIFKSSPEEKAGPLMKMIYSPEFLASPCRYDPSITWEQFCIKSFVERVKSEPKMTPRGTAGHLRCVTTHRVRSNRLALLRESRVPILIMTGTNDPLVRPKNSYILAQELNPVEFHVWEGAGHAINLECMDKFNEAIVRNVLRVTGKQEKETEEKEVEEEEEETDTAREEKEKRVKEETED